MTKSAKKLNIKDRVDDNTIDLSMADISEVPAKEIAVFKRVTIVDLSNNKISSLGPNIGLLAHLVKLDLSKNHIRMLPEAFGQLVNLRHLDLYNNQLDHLPLEMGQLKSLRYLDLKGNPLKVGLAKIVGTCLTVQECQLAAKRIVPFLADMQIQIREDRERLRQDKQLREAEQERLLQEQQQLEERNGQAQADGEGQAKIPKTKPKRERKRKDATAERSNGETVASSDDNISATIEQNDAAIRPSDNTNGRKFNRIILTVTLLLTLLMVVFRGYTLLSDEQKLEYTEQLDRWRQHVSTGIIVPMSRELIKVYQLCGQSITNIANLLSGWIRS